MRSIVAAALGLVVLACAAPATPPQSGAPAGPSAEAPQPPATGAPSQPGVPQRPPPPSGPDTCGMASRQHLIGAPASSIDRASLPPQARVICHNCPATMDHVPSRLNLMLDPQGRVESLRCG